MFFKRCVFSASLLLVVLVTGCAHPISVTADLAQVKGSAPQRIQKAVGYHISAEDTQREVTTPGGGGDSVKYQPYRDLDPAIYKALSEVFASVTKLDAPNDAAKISRDRIQLVFLPKVTTTSSSASAFTWPPTDFTVELVCKVSGVDGKAITELTAKGVGKAEFSEFKADHSLAAKRAAQDAIGKLVTALESTPALRQ
jgi:hypothetical protein